jgi:ribose/xylose/arabinose/galactoside ABC-type transport system permease subunit
MGEFFKRNPKESSLLSICVFIFLLMGLLSGGRFWNPFSLSSIMSMLPEFGFLALGMMMIILTGGLDLSLTYKATLTGITMVSVMAKLHEGGALPGVSIFLGLLAGLAVTMLCGFINGFLVVYIHVSPMLATLGTSLLFKGIGMNVTQGAALRGFPPEYSVINGMIGKYIPYTIIAFAIIAFILWVVMERSPRGVQIHMIGTNETAMNYSGINVRKLLMQVYMISALCCFFSAIIMIARYNSMKVDYGSSYLMGSVLVCVLGGVSTTGGYGKVGGVVLSAVTIQFLSSGLTVIGIKQSFVDIFMGLLLVLVLVLNFVLASFRGNKMLRMPQKNR